MTSNRPQNSILVLATLGVYLGLVLAGATPQILAQAATTRLFDVKDEIEYKEDLDTKPDSKAAEVGSAVKDYFVSLDDFFEDLAKLYSIEKFDPEHDSFSSSKVTYYPCPDNGFVDNVDAEHNFDAWLFGAINHFKYSTDNFRTLSDCLPYDGFKGRTKAKSVGFSLSYDTSELKYELSPRFSSATSAEKFYRQLHIELKQFRADDSDVKIKVLMEHTLLSRADNQVLITTRLPRAGLDALLATNAK